MNLPNTALARFFHAFVQNTNEMNTDTLLTLYAETFLAAGPQGAQCVRAADFALALPRRKEMFRSLGLQSTQFVGFRETWLDRRYVSVLTEWQFTFDVPRDTPLVITAESTFLLDTGSDPYRILAYISHHDVPATLKDRIAAASAVGPGVPRP